MSLRASSNMGWSAATVLDKFSTAVAKASASHLASDAKQTADVGFGGGIVVGDYVDTANATISGMTEVNAKGTLTVQASALKQFFTDRGVELVVLSSCSSMPQATSIASAVPNVVGTTSALDDEAGPDFHTDYLESEAPET